MLSQQIEVVFSGLDVQGPDPGLLVADVILLYSGHKCLIIDYQHRAVVLATRYESVCLSGCKLLLLCMG